MVSRQERKCGTKRQHDTKWEAQEHLDRKVLYQGANPNNYRTYVCPFCDYWHVGHKPGLLIPKRKGRLKGVR